MGRQILDERRTDLCRDPASFDLVAECGDDRRCRPDPNQASVDNRLRKLRALRQEAIAWVNRVRTGATGDVEDPWDTQIGVGWAASAEAIGFVSQFGVERAGIGIGIDRDRGDAVVPRGAGNADGDFAAIGDEKLSFGFS